MSGTTKPILEVLSGTRQPIPPVWFMRQAGRYLPEYRALRERAGSFLKLCFTPELAAEVTLQPVRRFGFDAAILFSDILVVPHALGRAVTFEAGEGPRLEPLDDLRQISGLVSQADPKVLAPVYDAIRLVKRDLPTGVALLGFCGAPWTVATYMIAGRGTPDQAPARMFAYREPEAFAKLIDILVEVSSRLSRSADQSRGRSGADFRYMGGRAAAARIFALVHRAGTQDCRERPRAKFPTQKSSAFRAVPARRLPTYVEKVPCRCGERRLGGRTRFRA